MPLRLMSLSVKQINQIANLARLELTDEEKQKYAEQLSAVLEYMEILNEVDTDGVPETCQVTGLEDVVRDDVVEGRDEETRRALLGLFSERKDDLLKVRGVFDQA